MFDVLDFLTVKRSKQIWLWRRRFMNLDVPQTSKQRWRAVGVICDRLCQARRASRLDRHRSAGCGTDAAQPNSALA